MLYDLQWLIYGPNFNEKAYGYVELMSHMLTVSMFRSRCKTLTTDNLKDSILEKLHAANCSKVLVEIFEKYVDTLVTIDNTLCYFVLFCSSQMDSVTLLNSIYQGSWTQNLIAGQMDHIDRIPGNGFLFQNEIPWLPWDITCALRNLRIPTAYIEKTSDIGAPVTESGQLSSQFTEILASQRLRLAASLFKPSSLYTEQESDDDEVVKSYIFDRKNVLLNLMLLYEGQSSDLFQAPNVDFFVKGERCEMRDDSCYYQLKETEALLTPHVENANRLLNIRKELLKSVKDSRKVIQMSCIRQLDALSTFIKRYIEGNHTLLHALNSILNVVQEKETYIKVCLKLIASSKSDYDLSVAISNMVSLTKESHYKELLSDFNKFIILSLVTYLTESGTSLHAKDYMITFCGESEDSKNRTLNEIIYTSRLLKIMRNNLHCSVDYDNLYEVSIKNSTCFENLEETLSTSNFLELPQMLKLTTRPLCSPNIVAALVTDFLDAMKLIASVFLPLSSHRMLQTNEVTKKNLIMLGVSRRHILGLKTEKGLLFYEAPCPLDLIITSNHSTRYAYIREQFFLLSTAYKALLEINLRENLFCLGEDRIAFFRRNKMISIVRCLLSHVVSMVRNIRDEMEVELLKVNSFMDLINIHRHTMRHLSQRTRLETKNTSTSRIITLIADYCNLFAAAFSQGDARSCDIHYTNFYDCIRVLSEKLGTETDNNYAKMLLVQFDSWGFLDIRRSETCSSRSHISLLTDSTGS